MDQFIGEIRLFAGNFAPRGWAFCEGQLIPISQNTALFSLLGVTYGGDGKTTFALPDFRGRAPMHAGSGSGLTPRQLGYRGGANTVTITTQQMPYHNHYAKASSSPTTSNPSEASWSNLGRGSSSLYSTTAPDVQMNIQNIGLTGGNQPHNNRQPYVGLNFIIALDGEFPHRP
ncbi:tail fiber protein [Bacillus carboniphilus]|uniref:Tail fiber protein n=1 Tax=Bacillus carboniphilus TaxID=86663 RepID=A0ABN0VXB0_9BACI